MELKWFLLCQGQEGASNTCKAASWPCRCLCTQPASSASRRSLAFSCGKTAEQDRVSAPPSTPFLPSLRADQAGTRACLQCWSQRPCSRLNFQTHLKMAEWASPLQLPPAPPGHSRRQAGRGAHAAAHHIYLSAQNNSSSGVCLTWGAGIGIFSLLFPVLDNHTPTAISSWTRDARQNLPCFWTNLCGSFLRSADSQGRPTVFLSCHEA